MRMQDAANNSPAGRRRRLIAFMVVPAVAALGAAMYFSLPPQSQPAGQIASSQADVHRLGVGQAHAAAGVGQAAWMPAPAPNSAEGNVVDMTY